MTSKELNKIQTDVNDALKNRRLRDAFETLQNAARAELMYDLSENISQAEQTYAYMLSYLTEGADDPERERLLDDLVAKSYILLDRLTVNVLSRETPTLYYNVRRYNKRQGQSGSLDAYIRRWHEALNRTLSIASLYSEASRKDNGAQVQLDSAEIQLFNAIWTSYPLGRQDAQTLGSLICDDDIPLRAAVRFTSALGLAATEFTDSEALSALCDIYSHYSDNYDEKSRRTAVAALVWLIIALYKDSDRVLPHSLRARLSALTDLQHWNRDVRLCFMELVRSRDTERITREMREEIIPGLMSMRPEIERKIKEISPDADIADPFSENPLWEEMLSDSGIGDKLKELNDLHMEGSDIYMGTFSHLKTFPFFNEIVGWFTPLTDDALPIEDIVRSNPDFLPLVTLVSKLPFICDSDKFSMLFSLEMFRGQQAQAMLSQLQAQTDNIDEMLSTSSQTATDKRRLDVRNYVQNLYRFVSLFRRKGEFYNFFKTDSNLLKVPLLSETLEDPDTLLLIGQFYFSHKYYTESLQAFHTLERIGEFDRSLFEKIGFAYEKTGKLDLALQYYEKADLLDSTSRWLRLRMVSVLRNLGQPERALRILSELIEKEPDSSELLMTQGYIHLNQGNYRNALKTFSQVEFLYADSTQTLRPLAWSLFMVGEFDRAAQYYNKVLLDNPTPSDYLNMGHTALAQSHFRDAVNFYSTFISISGSDGKKAFTSAIEADTPLLCRAGVKPSFISLITDAVLYHLS